MFHKKTVHKRLAMILGSIVGGASIGLFITYAVFSTTQEIPDTETGTIGYALSKIIAGNWQTNSIVGKSLQLGGVDGYKYLRLTGSLPLGCTQNNEALRSFNMDGTNVQCERVSSTRPRPILATVRDLDGTCFGGNFTRTNPGYSSGGTTIPSSNDSFNNSNVVDLYENDTLTTTGSCSLASLYMPDNSIIRMGPNSSITLRYAGIAGGSGATSTDLDNGELWARVLKPATDNSYFNVNTQEASVGVRGTSVYIKRNKIKGETIALPVDSGKIPDAKLSTYGAIVVYPANKTLNNLSVPLVYQATINGSGASMRIYTGATAFTGGTAPIYTNNSFIRKMVLADIKDFQEYNKNVGNLATLKTLKAEFMAQGGEKSKWDSSLVTTMSDQMLHNTTIDTEIARTIPLGALGAAERIALCGGAGSSEIWWNNVPTGYFNCYKSLLFFGDYRKNDDHLYSPGGLIASNTGISIANNGGITINSAGQYIQYQTGSNSPDINPSALLGSTITLTLSSAIGSNTTVAGQTKFYIADFGDEKWFVTINDVCTGVSNSTNPAGNYICHKIPSGGTQKVRDYTNEIVLDISVAISPTQLIFGNRMNLFSGVTSYPQPIGTTVQSISISLPSSGGSS